MSLADRIKTARIGANLTQKQLADALRVSVQAVSQWETGKTTPDFSRLAPLANVMRANFQWLCGTVDDADESSKQLLPKHLEGRAPIVAPWRILEFGILTLMDDFQLAPGQKSVETTLSYAGVCFAIEADEDRPELGITKSDLTIFNNATRPAPGDIAIIYAVWMKTWKVIIDRVESDGTIGGLPAKFPDWRVGQRRKLLIDNLDFDKGVATIIGTAVEHRRTLPAGYRSSVA